MNTILFHPETSQRRALILALGTYGAEGLSLGEREPLGAKLLDLYRNDPDAGIHGAAEWTVRKWGHQDKLKEVDAQLMKVKDWGERRWFINGEGQTFAVVEGPVEFRKGSMPTETERISVVEAPRPTVIPHRFAIDTKEVTGEQFDRFLRLVHATDSSYKDLASSHHRIKYSPDSQGPSIGASWYVAAHYCNWLSEQERIPKDQGCYRPNGSGRYNEGMSIPGDIMQRTGYRLPTEAEWEFACRAGTVTSRYYGNSIHLLGAYAWYQANRQERFWACGSLIPNDLGLFDMLGNVYEWCHCQLIFANPSSKGNTIVDEIAPTVFVSNRVNRPLRGDSFGGEQVRSASLSSETPYYSGVFVGFRPARTLP
jgi:formylglycine-generating enzyme required for sulfatase activity